MGLILFLSRVALIFNLFFAFVVLIHFVSFLEEQVVISSILIIGYALSVFLFTPLICLIYIICFLMKRDVFKTVSKWLVVTNFIFLLLQIIYITLFLNGAFYS